MPRILEIPWNSETLWIREGFGNLDSELVNHILLDIKIELGSSDAVVGL